MKGKEAIMIRRRMIYQTGMSSTGKEWEGWGDWQMQEPFYLRWSGKASRAQPSKGRERGSQAGIRGKRTSRSKGPEVGTCCYISRRARSQCGWKERKGREVGRGQRSSERPVILGLMSHFTLSKTRG